MRPKNQEGTAGFHPYTKFSLSLFFSGAAVLLDQPLSLALLTALAFRLFFSSRLPLNVIKVHLFLILTTIWGLMVSQGLFYQEYPRTVLFCLIPPSSHFSGLCFFREGLLYGLVQSLRLVAALTAGLYLVTSTPREILFRTVSALPLPRGLTLMSMVAVRFLPTVAEDLRLIRKALRLKGYRPLQRGIFYTLRVELLVIYPLLAKAVRQARTLSDTLLTRGFDPLSPASRAFLPNWPSREKALCLLLLVLAVCLLAAKIFFWLYLQELFYDENLRPLYALVRGYL